MNSFIEKDIGLRSLNDHIDTTTEHGRIIFNIFGSLAEFERELIKERTITGLVAARARGKKGGRPPGLFHNIKARVRFSCLMAVATRILEYFYFEVTESREISEKQIPKSVLLLN